MSGASLVLHEERKARFRKRGAGEAGGCLQRLGSEAWRSRCSRWRSGPERRRPPGPAPAAWCRRGWNRVPRIDGRLTPGEWNAAKVIDLGAGVTLLLENDARTLYLAVLDSADTVAGESDGLSLLFDDEGGAPPVLDDGTWSQALCQASAEHGEGYLAFSANQEVDYRETPQPTARRCRSPIG